MIGIVWGVSLLWIIPITSWPYIANNGTRIVPEHECDTEYKHNLAFKLITAIFNFYVPLIAMIVINTKIYLVIRERYHNPMMQYTSTPHLKYRWQQKKSENSCSSSSSIPSNGIRSVLRVASTIFTPKTKERSNQNTDTNHSKLSASNTTLNNGNIPSSTTNNNNITKDAKSVAIVSTSNNHVDQNIIKMFRNKKLSCLLNNNKKKCANISNIQNEYKTKSPYVEQYRARYTQLNYENKNPSPIYTPVKKKISTDAIDKIKLSDGDSNNTLAICNIETTFIPKTTTTLTLCDDNNKKIERKNFNLIPRRCLSLQGKKKKNNDYYYDSTFQNELKKLTKENTNNNKVINVDLNGDIKDISLNDSISNNYNNQYDKYNFKKRTDVVALDDYYLKMYNSENLSTSNDIPSLFDTSLGKLNFLLKITTFNIKI